jgi:hypothetical protein
MSIHLTPPIPVILQSLRLALPDVAERAGEVCDALRRQAEQAGQDVTGPPIFAARNLPRDAVTLFELEICLPVADAGSRTVLPPMRCLRGTFHGKLDDLFPCGYQPLLDAVAAAGLRPSGESREIYHRWDGAGSLHNRIEIQIGVR